MKGFTFGGTHSDEMSLIVNAIRIPSVPTINNNYEDIAGKDGVWDYGVRYGTRPIEVDCTIVAQNAQDLKQKVRTLVGHFNPRKGSKSFICDDDPQIQYFARLDSSLPLQQLGAMGTFTIQLVCTDPFTYSITETQVSGAGTLFANHNGTHEALPVVTIDHDGGVGSVELTRSDAIVETMTFNSNAPSGTYTVDCKKRTVTLNGSGADKYLEGDFFAMPNGSNKLVTSGGITNIDVKFNDTYL